MLDLGLLPDGADEGRRLVGGETDAGVPGALDENEAAAGREQLRPCGDRRSRVGHREEHVPSQDDVELARGQRWRGGVPCDEAGSDVCRRGLAAGGVQHPGGMVDAGVPVVRVTGHAGAVCQPGPVAP